MKLIAQTFLLLFIAFLLMPTILTLLEKTTNTCLFLDVSEEEFVKKEVVNYLYTKHFEPMILVQTIIETSVVRFEGFSKYDKILRIIFSPPPNRC
ncbi:MAG: hypothetical protein ACI87N_001479 [Flavobacteriales bacterium]|jgi:hypothetical protein